METRNEKEKWTGEKDRDIYLEVSLELNPEKVTGLLEAQKWWTRR